MDALWIAIGAIAVTLLNLYWDILKPALTVIWSDKINEFWWKLRESFIAIWLSIWVMLKQAYKKGILDAVISVIVKIIKSKLGFPTATRKMNTFINKR